MFNSRLLGGLVLAAFSLVGLSVAGTEPLPLSRTFQLPVRTARGNWVFMGDEGARQRFAMRVAPDQSVLVFDSDTNGKWPLVRLRKWWTEHPVTEVLEVPAWNHSDAKHLDRVFVDVQVTPDGRYAVAFAGAEWTCERCFIFFPPPNYVMRPPDTIITVIDLEQWRIVRSVHTKLMTHGRVSGVRILDRRWVAVDFIQEQYGQTLMHRHVDKLLWLPHLEPGPECVLIRYPAGDTYSSKEPSEPKSDNNSSCRNLLIVSGIKSVDEFVSRVNRAEDLEPGTVADYSKGMHEEEYFYHWGEYRDYHLVAHTPPLESRSHHWYGLYPTARRPPLYDLERFDSDGNSERRETISNALCGDSTLDAGNSACGCRPIDVSESSHHLLTYCRTQRGDYTGSVRREWLGVLRTDTFSGIGFIDLPKHEITEAIAEAAGRFYVLTVDFGEKVNVYEIPR